MAYDQFAGLQGIQGPKGAKAHSIQISQDSERRSNNTNQAGWLAAGEETPCLGGGTWDTLIHFFFPPADDRQPVTTHCHCQPLPPPTVPGWHHVRSISSSLSCFNLLGAGYRLDRIDELILSPPAPSGVQKHHVGNHLMHHVSHQRSRKGTIT
jgi:hypothetical protein